MTLTGTSGDDLGSFSARDADGTHAVIEDSRFLTAAADNGIAVVRFGL